MSSQMNNAQFPKIILGHNCPIIKLKIPIWYDKQVMYTFLISKNYSKEIAEELSELWATDLQQSFRKGFEKGCQYSKGENIDAIIEIIKP